MHKLWWKESTCSVFSFSNQNFRPRFSRVSKKDWLVWITGDKEPMVLYSWDSAFYDQSKFLSSYQLSVTSLPFAFGTTTLFSQNKILHHGAFPDTHSLDKFFLYPYLKNEGHLGWNWQWKALSAPNQYKSDIRTKIKYHYYHVSTDL